MGKIVLRVLHKIITFEHEVFQSLRAITEKPCLLAHLLRAKILLKELRKQEVDMLEGHQVRRNWHTHTHTHLYVT